MSRHKLQQRHLCASLLIVIGSTVNAEHQSVTRLLQAYPGQLCGAEGNTIKWCDGSTMQFDDGNASKTHEQKLKDADLQDQVEQEYPIGSPTAPAPARDVEPGRVRNEAFFKKMYGGTHADVSTNLADIIWLPHSKGQRLRVTTINHVNEHLQAVSDELDRLPTKYRAFVDNPGGTFQWRVIAGENRLSPHSFGIAIDIDVDTSDYWRWSASDGTNRSGLAFRNRIPMEIVEVFEKHGFIWGGRWYHYDTMHFEYRPELLDVRRPLF